MRPWTAACGVLLLAASTPSPAAAQQAPRPEWSAAVRYATSPPLRELPPQPPGSTRTDFKVKLPALPQDASVTTPDASLQTTTVAQLSVVTNPSFDGIGEGSKTDNEAASIAVEFAPPDMTGEAGTTQFVQWVNTKWAVFSKGLTPSVVQPPRNGNELWASSPAFATSPCATRNDGDPIVQWDQLANRWVVSQFALQSGSYRQCVAISKTADATGQWHLYEFAYAEFPDYPKLSVWHDAYYVTFNMFGSSGRRFTGGRVCAYDKARMLNGEPASQVCYQLSNYASLLAADLDGTTPAPAGTAAYILNRGTSQLRVWRFVPNFTTPAASTFSASPASLAVAAFSTCSGDVVPQPDTTTKLDGMCDRLMYRVTYRNLGTRQAMLVSHTVAANGVTGVRWYELDAGSATPTIRQQGTYAPNDGLYRWMSSAAMDKVGNIAIGYSVGNATTHPSIRFAGREAAAGACQPTDACALSAEIALHDGKGSQNSGLARWGDYSHMAVDPTDDCTFWYTSEYLQSDGAFNWRTRIGSFSFPSCTEAPPPGPSLTLAVDQSSRTVTVGGSTTYTATVTGQNGYAGSGVFDVTGLPSGSTASWSPTTFTGGSETATLTVATTSNVVPGTNSLTISATDSTVTPALTATAQATLVVNPLPDFSLSVSPTSRSVRRGKSTSATVSVSAIGGFSEVVTLEVTGLPSDVTASFSPATVAGSGSSTLTLRASSKAIPGTYPVTIRGTSASGESRSTTLTLTIQ